VVVSHDDINASMSFRNLPDVHVLLAGELNAYDVLCCDWIVFTEATVPGAPAEKAAPAPAAPTAPEPTEVEA
jgi:large subunit ribosomal protein L4